MVATVLRISRFMTIAFERAIERVNRPRHSFSSTKVTRVSVVPMFSPV